MSSYETCRECDSETGRAGASEDSLYHSYVGPFCEDCYDDWPDKIEAELAKVRREFRDFRAGQAASVPDMWRDVDYEVPEQAQEVILVLGEKVVHGAWIGGMFWHNNRKVEATKWMPLPQPPNQEDQ